MLISKKVKIKAGSRKFKYYQKLGYNINSSKELFEIDIKDLSEGSKVLVSVKCDYCGKVLSVIYKNYIKHNEICNKDACLNKDCSNQKIKDVCVIKYGVENPFQSDFVKEKIKKTFNEKYGVNHQMELQEVKDKIKKTCLKKYGVVNPKQSDKVKSKGIISNLKNWGVVHDSKLSSQQEKRKQTRIKRGNQIPDHLLESYFLYRRKVDNISDRLKNDMLKDWNGYDYYDGEYIKDNFSLTAQNVNYPTLDHKISVFYGFSNNLDIEQIANIDNLCFTKNRLNSQKGSLNENEYRLKFL